MYLEISESSELNFISVNPSCPHTFSSCRMVTIAIWFVAVSILDGPENNHNHNSPAADHKTRHWLLTLHSTIATPIPWPLSPLSSLSSIPSPHLLHPFSPSPPPLSPSPPPLSLFLSYITSLWDHFEIWPGLDPWSWWSLLWQGRQAAWGSHCHWTPRSTWCSLSIRKEPPHWR